MAVTRILHATGLVALLAAAFVAMLRDGGSSPIAWMDTFNEEREVQRCLAEEACTRTGVSTSVPGLVHAVGWLQWRTALAWAGFDVDTVHVAVLALNAFATVLVFHLASRLGGALAGAVAGWLFLDGIAALLRLSALHNSSALLFLGAVLLLACTAVVERPGAASVTLAALVAAVIANVHIVGVACGVSVVWVAALAPRRRWALTALGIAVFTGATVAIAPGTWSHDLATLLVRPTGHPFVPPPPRDPVLVWSLFGIGAWLIAHLVPAPAWRVYRRRALGAIAVAAPLVIAFAIAPRLGFYAEPKYLLHGKAAGAVAAALPSALLVRPLRRAAPRVAGALDAVLPLALAAVLLDPGIVPGTTRGAGAAGDLTPTLADLRTAATILHREHGWDAARAHDAFKTAYGVTAQVGLAQALAPLGRSAAAPTAALRDASLLVVATRELPAPLPPEWQVVRRSTATAAVLVTSRPVIDWSAFEVCTLADGEPEWRCTAGGRHDGVAAPGMPAPGRGWHGRIRISAALRPRPAAEPVAIFMPRIATSCSGRIVAAPAGAAVAADGRRADVAAPSAADVPSRVTLEWTVGAPECTVIAYDGAVPFLVEGDAAAVRRIETILRGRET